MASFLYCPIQKNRRQRVARSPAPHYPQNHLGPGSLAPNFGDHGPSDSALAASSAWRLRRPGADRHAARCASRDLCSGGAPRRYTPSDGMGFPFPFQCRSVPPGRVSLLLPLARFHAAMALLPTGPGGQPEANTPDTPSPAVRSATDTVSTAPCHDGGVHRRPVGEPNPPAAGTPAAVPASSGNGDCARAASKSSTLSWARCLDRVDCRIL